MAYAGGVGGIYSSIGIVLVLYILLVIILKPFY